MALLDNSYGDTSEIAALVKRYANANGLFDATTNPTLAQVESEADQISATLNLVLIDEGFGIPIDEATAKLSLDMFVNKITAEVIHGMRGAGRFGPTAQSKKGAKGAYLMILEDATSFIQEFSSAFERLGADRPNTITSEIAFRDTDKSGDESSIPIYQREGFGETRKEWDD